ncbi:hypothetical protein E1265_36650, partial [Streptomyces sp. 8K308]|uniref:hypothetical protein n=1 Tax=Streptomyces sp. 8K308 TaxID=2530388 RepID=UPI001049F489
MAPTSLNAYLRTPEEYDPMDRSAPVRLHVLDTARQIERALVDTADHIAAEIQIPARSHVPPAARRPGTWTADYRARLDRAADQDAAAPRRWRYTGQRTAPTAAAWLLDRLVSLPGGIFHPLTLGHRAAIEQVAQTAADHVEHALGLARRAVEIPGRPCACGGTLMLHGGRVVAHGRIPRMRARPAPFGPSGRRLPPP